MRLPKLLSGQIFGGLNLTRIRYVAYAASASSALILLVVGYLTFYLGSSFHLFIALGIVAACSAPALIYHFEGRRKKLIDDMLPRLLEDIAESQDAGMTLLQALEESSRRNYGPMTVELKRLVTQLSWGVEFEAAFNSFSKRIGTELSVRVTSLLMESIGLGGDIKSTFKATAEFVRKMLGLRDERESQLKPYLMVIYISSLVFMIILVILYQSFFLTMATGSSERFLRLPLSLESYKAVLFDLAIVEAFFGGLIAAKLSQKVTITGLKHILILLSAVSLIFGIFFVDIVPPTLSVVGLRPPTPKSTSQTVVMASISDWGSAVKNATLYYTTDKWATYQPIEMEYDATDELWKASIPPTPIGTWVWYYIEAYDNSDLRTRDDNGGFYYRYNVAP